MEIITDVYKRQDKEQYSSFKISLEFSSEYPNYELNLFYGSVSEIINGLGNNKRDFGFSIENSKMCIRDRYQRMFVYML